MNEQVNEKVLEAKIDTLLKEYGYGLKIVQSVGLFKLPTPVTVSESTESIPVESPTVVEETETSHE